MIETSIALTWFLPLIAFIATMIGLYSLLKYGLASQLAIDEPNHRSLHSNATPRIGGLVLVPAFLFVWLLQPDSGALLALLVALLTLFSFLDDRADLSAALRLGGHLAAAAVFVAFQLDLHSVTAEILAIVWIGWCTNLYNFMDGADGLAGGMALFGFSAYGLVAAMSGQHTLSIASFSVAAAAAGFLLFNFPPAKTFMGDAGSISLGFLAGAIGLLGWNAGIWPIWFPVLVFSPFIVDATVTLLKRALRTEKIWQAHHDHYYQRLVRMGWSHRRLALAEYCLMLACSVSALWLIGAVAPVKYFGLVAWVSIYALAMVMIDICWKKHLNKKNKS